MDKIPGSAIPPIPTKLAADLILQSARDPRLDDQTSADRVEAAEVILQSPGKDLPAVIRHIDALAKDSDLRMRKAMEQMGHRKTWILENPPTMPGIEVPGLPPQLLPLYENASAQTEFERQFDRHELCTRAKATLTSMMDELAEGFKAERFMHSGKRAGRGKTSS